MCKSVITGCSYNLWVVNKTNYQSERRLSHPNTLQYHNETSKAKPTLKTSDVIYEWEHYNHLHALKHYDEHN
jgi:hypothetical protein